jgi:tetratricopeptide (TPR) repeat protein
MRAVVANRKELFQAAREHAGESLRLYQKVGDLWDTIQPHTSLGRACLSLGDYALARHHFGESIRLARESGDIGRAAAAANQLGFLELQVGNLTLALDTLRLCLMDAVTVPDNNLVASCFGLVAIVLARQKQAVSAARFAGAAETLYHQQGILPWEDSSLSTLFPGWQDRADAAEITRAFEEGRAVSAEQLVSHWPNRSTPLGHI